MRIPTLRGRFPWSPESASGSALVAGFSELARRLVPSSRQGTAWDVAVFLETGSPARVLSLSPEGLSVSLDSPRGCLTWFLSPSGSMGLEYQVHTWPLDELRVTGVVRTAPGTGLPVSYGVRVVPRAWATGRIERSVSASRIWTPGASGRVETFVAFRAGLRQSNALLRLGVRVRVVQGRSSGRALAALVPAWMRPDPEHLDRLLERDLAMGLGLRPWSVAAARWAPLDPSALRSQAPPVTMAG